MSQGSKGIIVRGPAIPAHRSGVMLCMVFVLLVIGFFMVPQLPGAQPQPDSLTKAEARAIARELAGVLETKYIQPAAGKKIADLIRGNITAGAYDGLLNCKDLAARLHRDAQSVNRDRHIAVYYLPERIQNQQNPQLQKKQAQEARQRARMNNHGFREARILAGNIGYLKMNGFDGTRAAFETATAAMQFLASSYAVIIDLRWNPGGDSRMVQLISSYFLGSDPQILDVFHFRESNRIEQLWSLPYVPGRTLEGVDVYILTSGFTFSAAEGLAYDLQALKRATIVGETTMGGGHAVETVTIKDKLLVNIPHAVSINPVTRKNFQGVGVIPDVKASCENALHAAHALALKKRIVKETNPSIKSALQWALEGLPSRAVGLTPEEKQAYAGTYGPFTIVFDRGYLFLQFGPGKLRMTPVTAAYFLLENYDAFRIKINKAQGNVTGIQLCYKSKKTEAYPKR